MHCRHVLPQTLVKPQHVVSRPLAPLPRISGHKQYTTAVHAAAAEEAAADREREQPTAEQQQSKGEQQLKARIKRLASSWTDNSTPNTGLIRVTNKSVASSAAACVVADLKEKALTRIVARSSAEIPKAINVINIATQMVNGQNSNAAEQQQQHQEQQLDTAVQQQVLLFQPVRVDGVLVAPPALPAGAAALYTYMLSTDNKALQVAMAERAELRAAAAASSSSSSDDASSSSRRLSAGDGFVSVNSSSNARGVARAIVESIRTRGWAELTSYGGPLATQQAVEALMSARGLLYRQSKQDVAAVFLKFWKKESKVAAGASQQSGVSAEHATAGQRQQQGQGQEDKQPLLFRCATFLLVACAKNKPLQLVVPSPPQQQQLQQQPQ